MKHILIILIALIGFSVFPSCKKGHPRKVATIDSLIVKLDSVSVEFNKINKDTIASMNNYFKNSLPVLAQVLAEKPEPAEKNLLVRWSMNKKPFKFFLERNSKYKEELEYSKNQLLSLKDGVKSNDIPKDSIDIYLNQEKKASNQIINDVKTLTGQITVQTREFDTLKPVVIKIIDKYNKIKLDRLNKK